MIIVVPHHGVQWFDPDIAQPQRRQFAVAHRPTCDDDELIANDLMEVRWLVAEEALVILVVSILRAIRLTDEMAAPAIVRDAAVEVYDGNSPHGESPFKL